MYCRNCGTEIGDDSTFCSKCGCIFEEKKIEQVEKISDIEQGKRYCDKCGAEVYQDAIICPKCGCCPGKQSLYELKYQEPKTIIGVIMALFLGLIGLIIGIVIYPKYSVSRQTFVRAWTITFLISIAFWLLLFALYVLKGTQLLR